MRSLSAIAARG